MRQLRPGVWQLAVSTPAEPGSGSGRVYRTVHGSESDASRALAELVVDVGSHRVRPAASRSPMTVAELLQGYLQHLAHDKGRKHSTLYRYEGLASSWIAPILGDKRADRVRPDDIDHLLGRMRRADQSASSMHQTFTLLNGAFKWAKRNGHAGVRENPLIEVEKPRSTQPAREVVPPDVETLRTLLRTALEVEFGFGVACQVGAVTGMRRGELAGLRWRCVNLVSGQLLVESTVNDAGGKVVVDRFTKTRRGRWVTVDGGTLELLRRLHEDMRARAQACGVSVGEESFVFSNSADGEEPIRPEYLTRRMQRLRADLALDGDNFDATLQALRHWTQTALNEAGFNPQQVAMRGGHTPRVMNRVYVHRTRGADAKMTEHIGELLR